MCENEDKDNITVDKKYHGRVKWFNKRLGYGFIEFKDNNNNETNIFGHYSKIKPLVTTYKTLYQGEYVDFKVETSKRPEMDYQAYDITGIDGGLLMADTHEMRSGNHNDFDKPGPAHINNTY
tara:strand:+ start:1547 stop:1912 length:366 start_codon:yes stop_codon:yes gene_type:complete